MSTGAEEESRTLDLNLGKVALYQLSYFRICKTTIMPEKVLIFKDNLTTFLQFLERKKSLELSTSTLARLRSTN